MDSPTNDDDLQLPTGKDLDERWAQLSRAAQGQLWSKVRRGETSQNVHEARMIAALAKQRLRDWTMRPHIVLPAFVGAFALLALVWDEFSLASALSAPLIYAGYMLWMRNTYMRAYRRSAERLRAEPGDHTRADA